NVGVHNAFGKGKSFAPNESGTGLCIESDRLATLMQDRQDIASQHNPSLALGNILRSGLQSARSTHHRGNNGDDSATRDHESADSGHYFESCPSEGADDSCICRTASFHKAHQNGVPIVAAEKVQRFKD